MLLQLCAQDRLIVLLQLCAQDWIDCVASTVRAGLGSCHVVSTLRAGLGGCVVSTLRAGLGGCVVSTLCAGLGGCVASTLRAGLGGCVVSTLRAGLGGCVASTLRAGCAFQCFPLSQLRADGILIKEEGGKILAGLLGGLIEYQLQLFQSITEDPVELSTAPNPNFQVCCQLLCHAQERIILIFGTLVTAGY